MSRFDEIDFDPFEYADQLGYMDELTRNDFTEPEAVRAETPEQRRLSRRDMLVKGGVGAAALTGLGAMAGRAAAAPAAPAAADQFSGTLQVISLGVEWPPGAEQRAEQELGFKFNVQLMGTNAQVQKSITAPKSFDIGGLYNYQFFQIWPTGNFQPVDTRRLRAWRNLYPLFTRGRVNPANRRATYGDGNAPFRVMFVDRDRSTGLPLTKEGPKNNKQIVQWVNERTGKPFGGKPMPRWILGPPAHFNMDSMGYNADELQRAPGAVSWAELLNRKWRGRVALLNDPGIMTQDAGNAVKALGIMKFQNLGNMTRGEMDRLFKVLTTYKKAGHFRAFWSTFNESVNLMASKEVVIESMWSPAVALLVAQGVNCRYAAPKEGFRGWCSAQGIPKAVTGAKLQAAYDYLNWMYDGYLGALIMRQGYYIANGRQLPEWIRSAKGRAAGFDIAEYDFWYGGKRAAKDLPGITGQVGDVKKGQIRDGGAFTVRSTKYSSWNSFFTNNVYQVKKVNEFLSA
ncbi:MAG TPA: extracellular solute-binding protein [Gaiellaceae bacterium]|nr:extracellular solute-binding protein [Gaiellaceae bacterium]